MGFRFIDWFYLNLLSLMDRTSIEGFAPKIKVNDYLDESVEIGLFR